MSVWSNDIKCKYVFVPWKNNTEGLIVALCNHVALATHDKIIGIPFPGQSLFVSNLIPRMVFDCYLIMHSTIEEIDTRDRHTRPFVALTHLPLDKIAAILQTRFSNASLVLCVKLHICVTQPQCVDILHSVYSLRCSSHCVCIFNHLRWEC